MVKKTFVIDFVVDVMYMMQSCQTPVIMVKVLPGDVWRQPDLIIPHHCHHPHPFLDQFVSNSILKTLLLKPSVIE